MPLMLLLLGTMSTGSVQAATAEPRGISFYVLRVVYPEQAKKGVTLTAYNKSEHPYLMQSWVRPMEPQTGDVELGDTGETATPFIVTPPLQRLEPGGELTLRIRRTGDALPADRESVFFVSMKAIPRQVQADTATKQMPPAPGQMTLTVVSNLKLFYRPDGLAARAVADAAPQLRFRHDGRDLIAENPTPYWLTFSRLSIGEQALDKSALRLMVPPKGQQRYRLPTGAHGPVVWQLIDEDGWDTPRQQQPL
ncbi:fimbria/pilus periplasmic chaperone [Serratia fonticola]|nr:fimbria/pilus periplasmic chaperone [Serratia fonticola]